MINEYSFDRRLLSIRLFTWTVFLAFSIFSLSCASRCNWAARCLSSSFFFLLSAMAWFFLRTSSTLWDLVSGMRPGAGALVVVLYRVTELVRSGFCWSLLLVAFDRLGSFSSPAASLSMRVLVRVCRCGNGLCNFSKISIFCLVDFCWYGLNSSLLCLSVTGNGCLNLATGCNGEPESESSSVIMLLATDALRAPLEITIVSLFLLDVGSGVSGTLNVVSET